MIQPQSGIFLPTFWSDYGARGMARALTETAAAADALGFDSLWACDHIVAPEQNAGSARCLEPLILMAGLAQQFPRLLVGTNVLVLPQRNALLVAKQAATLAALSGDRLILGIGAGWNQEEFRLLGADFANRGRHTDEAIRLMKALWRQTPTSFAGEFYTLDNTYFYPDPAGDGPPVWIGGTSGAALSRAARLGDGWMPFWSKWDAFTRDLDAFRAQAARLRASPRGPSLRIAANVPLCIQTGADEHATDTPQTVDTVISVLRAYRAAGLETIIWNIQSGDLDDYIAQMRIAAGQILPAVMDSAAPG